jgi:hypothetical protein
VLHLLHASDEASFDDVLTGVGPAPDRFTRAAASESEAEAAVCAQLGLKPGTLASS